MQDHLFDKDNLEASMAELSPGFNSEEQANLELHGISFPNVSVTDLTPVELHIVAKLVNETMEGLEKDCRENPALGAVDTVRLALMTAFKLGTEIYKLKRTEGAINRAVDRITEKLEESLRPNQKNHGSQR